MKLWETEYFAMDFTTGDMKRVIGEFFYEGENMEQAMKALIKSNKPWIRLTGGCYVKVDKSTADDLENNTPEVENDVGIDPTESGFKITDALRDMLMNMEMNDDMLKDMQESIDDDDDDDDDDEDDYGIPKNPKYEINWGLLSDLTVFVKGMSIDEFLDWLDLQDWAYIHEILKHFKKGKLDAYVKTIEGHLKNKYGESNEESLNDEEN